MLTSQEFVFKFMRFLCLVESVCPFLTIKSMSLLYRLARFSDLDSMSVCFGLENSGSYIGPDFKHFSIESVRNLSDVSGSERGFALLFSEYFRLFYNFRMGNDLEISFLDFEDWLWDMLESFIGLDKYHHNKVMIDFSGRLVKCEAVVIGDYGPFKDLSRNFQIGHISSKERDSSDEALMAAINRYCGSMSSFKDLVRRKTVFRIEIKSSF